jgi:hypothetical protein
MGNLSVNKIESRIFTIRKLYGVETRIINQAVKRNLERFIPKCGVFFDKRNVPQTFFYIFPKSTK